MDHELRRLTLGGSEIGAIFGVDENRDAFSVWWSKKGNIDHRPDEPNERMIVGKALEQGVLALYTHVTGRRVEYHDRTMIHPTRPWMAFTPDALCLDERRGVDAKVVFWDQRRKWGDRVDEIPERIQLQCWWYMAALDFDEWDVAALIGEGLPRIYTLHRDAEVERAMLARAQEWHNRYLIGDDRPPLGASAEAGYWLHATFPNHRRPDIREATEPEADLLANYLEVRGAQKLCTEERARLENMLKEAVGESEGLASETARFTWRKTKDSTVTDWHSMALALMTHYISEDQARALLLEQYTRVKPGNRRIHFTADELEGGDAE